MKLIKNGGAAFIPVTEVRGFRLRYCKYVQILNKYKDIISSPPDLILTEDPSTGDYFVSLNIAFNPHPRYGTTRLRIREKYNSSEELYFYRYCWEMNCKPTGNINA